MIALGSYDPTLATSALDEYKKLAMTLTGVSGSQWNSLRGEGGWTDFAPATGNEMTVIEVQEFLKSAGFFPDGTVDGICGYRTTSAIRLFQEYVRTDRTGKGRPEIVFPDGQFDQAWQQHARRWMANGWTAD